MNNLYLISISILLGTYGCAQLTSESLSQRSSGVNSAYGEYPPLPNGEQADERSFIGLLKNNKGYALKTEKKSEMAVGLSAGTDLVCDLSQTQKHPVSATIKSISGKSYAIVYMTEPCAAAKKEINSKIVSDSGMGLTEGYVELSENVVVIEGSEDEIGTSPSVVISTEGEAGCTSIDVNEDTKPYVYQGQLGLPGSFFRSGFEIGPKMGLLINGNAKTWKISLDNKSRSRNKGLVFKKNRDDIGNSIIAADPSGKTLILLKDIVPAGNDWNGTSFSIVVQGLASDSSNLANTCTIEGSLHSPLVFDLSKDQKFTTVGVAASKVSFDLNNDGIPERTGWISEKSGFLVRDRNGNGIIDDGSELYGEYTAGQKYSNGYEALIKDDQNNDGFIDEKDNVFSTLYIWVDLNSNGRSETKELSSLKDFGITRIATNYESLKYEANSFENQVRFSAKFYGPSYCPKKGCNSYDVFFANFQGSLTAQK